ncbi:MAG: flagellar protein FlgN [Treponema sp.]|jgi:small-conductance mechanosensitive channel|nr:flagellar protein FlgN [Treponema sp.]
MEHITQKELDERIAILRKFRHLLEQQRDKFREYLTVLEKQQSSIVSEDAEALVAHTELEQQVVKNILQLQKVIVPMDTIYHTVNGNAAAVTDDSKAVPALQADLEDLEKQVLEQNRKNRALLRSHITEIRDQLTALKNPYRFKRSIYAEKKAVGSLVEIEI